METWSWGPSFFDHNNNFGSNVGSDFNDVAKHQLRSQYQVLCPVASNVGMCNSAYPNITVVMLHNIVQWAVCLFLY